MKVLIENIAFNHDIQLLIDKLDSYKKVKLYYSSRGGTYFHYKIFLDYLNSRKKDIVLVPYDEIHSCGTLLLLYFKGKVVIDTEILELVVTHQISRLTETDRVEKPLSKKFLANSCKKYNKGIKKTLKSYLTKKELKRFSKGEDVLLNVSILKEMLT